MNSTILTQIDEIIMTLEDQNTEVDLETMVIAAIYKLHSLRKEVVNG